MKLLVTKTSVGVLDTDRERQRICKAFKDGSIEKKKLIELMDAIEAFDWKLAKKLLSDKWWEGRDEEGEFPRVEYLGMLSLQNPERPGHLANGFDNWASYDELVFLMTDPEHSKRYKVEEIKNG